MWANAGQESLLIYRWFRRRHGPYGHFQRLAKNYESEINTMTNPNEAKDHIPQEKIQFKYLTKSFEARDLEISIGYSTGNECADLIEKELERPGYCEAAKKFIMWKLDELTWRIERGEDQATIEEDGINPKDDPRYPMLERLWSELEQLERKLPPIPLYLCTRSKGPYDYMGFPLDDNWVYKSYEDDFSLDLAMYIDDLRKNPAGNEPLLQLLQGIEAIKALQSRDAALQAKCERLEAQYRDSRYENYDLECKNSFLESEKKYLEQAILKLCNYYSQPTGTTPEMASEVLELSEKTEGVCIYSIL